MSTTKGIVAAVIYFIGILAGVISFALPYWSSYTYTSNNVVIETDLGIWHYCTIIAGTDKCYTWLDIDGYFDLGDMGTLVINGLSVDMNLFRATQASEAIGLSCAVIAVIALLLLVFWCNPKRKSFYRTEWVVIIFSGLAGFFTFLGVFIYGVAITQTLHVSFALALVAGLLYLFGGIVIVY